MQLVGAPNSVLFGTPFFVEGTLSGTGASSHEIVLQANPFPYLAGFKDVGNPEVANSAGDFSFPHVRLLGNRAAACRDGMSRRRRSVRSSASSCSRPAPRSMRAAPSSQPAAPRSRVSAASCACATRACIAR